MTINFYLNNEPRGAINERAIYCYIRQSGKTITLHTGESITAKHWDVTKQIAKRGYIGHPELNDFLISYKEKIKSIIRQIRIEDPFASFEDIRTFIFSKIRNKVEFEFFNVFDSFISIQRPKVTKATITKFKTIKRHLETFEKNYGSVISFDGINLTFFDHLYNYFVEVNISHNTTVKYIRFIKEFLRWAYDRDYTQSNKFEKYKSPKVIPTVQIALSKAEFEKVRDCNWLDERLQRVRDLFLFQTYTGQRHGDVFKLKSSDVKDGVWYLTQGKTKKVMEIPLIKPAIEILEKYQYKLPVISNQKLNQYLKELGKVAKLNDKISTTRYVGSKATETSKFKWELLTTHTARRTFVSLASYDNVNQQVVKSFTGHSTDKMVGQYFKKDNAESREVIENIFTN